MYFLCSENKGAHQLCGYRPADLRLCFRICKIAGFFMMWLISYELYHMETYLWGSHVFEVPNQINHKSMHSAAGTSYS